jgi:hypothetical protein
MRMREVRHGCTVRNSGESRVFNEAAASGDLTSVDPQLAAALPYLIFNAKKYRHRHPGESRDPALREMPALPRSSAGSRLSAE